MTNEDATKLPSDQDLQALSVEWIDALKAKRQRPTIRVKRRRQWETSPGVESQDAFAPAAEGVEKREGRTFRLSTTGADPSEPEAASPGEVANDTESTPPRSRRRRTDPSRRPGVVSRIVYDRPGPGSAVAAPPRAAVESGSPGARAGASSPYRDVLRALSELHATLEAARSAAEFELA